MIVLRDYQQAAVDSVFECWKKEKGNPLIVAPCGAGKSLILAELVRLAMQWPGTRVLVLTHRKELLEQDEAALRLIWPDAPTGFFSAGLGEKDMTAPITFAGIQSVERVIHEFEPFDLCLIDEAHLLPRSAHTRYGRVVEALRLMRPTCRFIGLTATPYRLDSGMLHEGEGALFDAITYDIPLQMLIDRGYLCPLVSVAGAMQADMTGVARRGGEYVLKEMAAAFDSVIGPACQQIIEQGQDRRAWLLFCASIEHAEIALDTMRAAGIDAALIVGTTPKDERRRIIERFKSGQLRCLINVDVLTIGFDVPNCDLLALIRATESTALYVQIMGRGMRTSPGKEDCLVLDFGGNVVRHGPVDAVQPQPRAPGKGEGDAPAKECPDCALIVPAGVRECPGCGYEFPPPEPELDEHAFSGALLKSQLKPQRLPVLSQTARIHAKPGKPPSVMVAYVTPGKTVREWLCPEHGGYAAQVAALAVMQRYGERCPPRAADLWALVMAQPPAEFVIVKKDGKFDRIISVEIANERTSLAR